MFTTVPPMVKKFLYPIYPRHSCNVHDWLQSVLNYSRAATAALAMVYVYTMKEDHDALRFVVASAKPMWMYPVHPPGLLLYHRHRHLRWRPPFPRRRSPVNRHPFGCKANRLICPIRICRVVHSLYMTIIYRAAAYTGGFYCRSYYSRSSYKLIIDSSGSHCRHQIS